MTPQERADKIAFPGNKWWANEFGIRRWKGDLLAEAIASEIQAAINETWEQAIILAVQSIEDDYEPEQCECDDGVDEPLDLDKHNDRNIECPWSWIHALQKSVTDKLRSQVKK